jgi:hypothetical protein
MREHAGQENGWIAVTAGCEAGLPAEGDTMTRFGLAAIAATLVAGCTMTPTVTKVSTTMTPREIRDAGLICKQLPPIDSNVPRTICASEAAWDAYAEETRLATDELLYRGRELGNAFGRP